MAIDVTCPCGRKMISADKYAGRLIKCPACSREVRVPQPAAEPPASETSSDDLDPRLVRSRKVIKVIKRYRDAYVTAALILMVGKVVKFLGVLAGTGTFIVTVVVSKALSGGGEPPAAGVISGIILGVMTGLVIFLIGTVVSAAGQLLLASLDSAVHSSPFLSDEERAEAMSV